MPAPSSRHARRTHASPSPSPSLPVKMRDGKLSTVRGPLSCSAELPLLSSDPACHRYASTRRRLRPLVAPTRWKAAHADGKCIAQAMRVVSLSLSLSLSLSAESLLHDGARAARCNSGAQTERRQRSRYLSRSPPQAPRCSMQPRATLAYSGHARAHTSSSCHQLPCHQLPYHQRPTLLACTTPLCCDLRNSASTRIARPDPAGIGARRGARCCHLWLPATRGRKPQPAQRRAAVGSTCN